jgi:hypothetical protein
MEQELPPRNWVVVDEKTTRLANDEEYAQYLAVVIGQEGLLILPTESSKPPILEND